MGKIQEICACAFIRKGEKVLVAKRAETKSFLPGKYELLGGHVEFGETLQDCLKRELKEELHVDISVEMPFYSFTSVYDKQTKHYIEIDYFAHLKNPDQKIKLNKQDHSSYKWISDSDVYKYFDRKDAEAKAIKEGFRILKRFRLGKKTKEGIAKRQNEKFMKFFGVLKNDKKKLDELQKLIAKEREANYGREFDW